METPPKSSGMPFAVKALIWIGLVAGLGYGIAVFLGEDGNLNQAYEGFN